MYSENSYKNYIFWLKVKQIFVMILLSVIGCVIGRLIGQYLVEVLLFDISNLYVSVTVSTLLFFAIAALITSGTSREVQEAYWRIAVLRKLTVISKKLDVLPVDTKKEIKDVVKNVAGEEVTDIVDDMIGE